MTLIGLDSRSEEFDNLTLTVGMGTKLTLQDVRITGDKTLLSLAGGNTLTLLGENRLIGCADASGNTCPTVIAGTGQQRSFYGRGNEQNFHRKLLDLRIQI